MLIELAIALFLAVVGIGFVVVIWIELFQFFSPASWKPNTEPPKYPTITKKFIAILSILFLALFFATLYFRLK